MTVEHVPVLIVGGGAAGLACSALLAKHGVGSLLVEKRSEVFVYPKARNLSFRSLEILRRLGLADEVHAIAQGVSGMIAKPTLNSTEESPAVDVDAIFSPFDGMSPEPSGQYCPQSAFEPMLLSVIRRHGSRARYNTELVSFEQDDSGVTAVIRDQESGATETVRADYLVAADGVHSPIRDTLGVTTSGYGALPIYVVFVYFRAPWRKFVPQLGDGDGVQVRNADVDGIFLPVRDDFGMFITTYFPDNGESADQFTAHRCRELLAKAIGVPVEIEVIDVAPWQPYERVADQFHSGRVFLVGDSAHTMPPFKAGGANTAIQSAHNLAWKLAAVLNGTAGPALLSTYHAERHPVGRFNARQSLTGPSLGFLRLDENRPQLPADEEAPMFPLLIGYQYRSTAVVYDDPVAADADTVSLVEELRGQPGTRIPHAWVLVGGKRVSTLDLLGPGFTLCTGGEDPRWSDAATSVSKALGVPITVQCIGTALDIDGSWAAATGLAPDGALLVRPDDFVAWRADEFSCSPESDLARVLRQILGRADTSLRRVTADSQARGLSWR
jgi:2-polyprenyl-6-methoxyphenol hydroxylase-like FAD-dependent oxidoreductase